MKLIEHTLDGYKTIVTTAAYTGLRQSELLGLRWHDIGFDDGLIRVRHQLSRATRDKPARLIPLKSEAGERNVELPDELAPLLKQHREGAFRRGHAKAEDYVFATVTGAPMYCRNVSSRGLDKAADGAGLNPEGVPKLTMHDLRHTAISRMIRQGVDVATVQRQAGHSKPSITLDIYSHEFGEAERTAETKQKLRAASRLGLEIRPLSDQTAIS